MSPFALFWSFFWLAISEEGRSSRKISTPLGMQLKSTRRSEFRDLPHVPPHRGENPPRDPATGGVQLQTHRKPGKKNDDRGFVSCVSCCSMGLWLSSLGHPARRAMPKRLPFAPSLAPRRVLEAVAAAAAGERARARARDAPRRGRRAQLRFGALSPLSPNAALRFRRGEEDDAVGGASVRWRCALDQRPEAPKASTRRPPKARRRGCSSHLADHVELEGVREAPPLEQHAELGRVRRGETVITTSSW